MGIQLFANDATSTLAGAITNVATTATLATGTGALFPTPTTNQYFTATLRDQATGLLNEIVHVTNVTGDVVTIVRAQEGTTALAWTSGDLFDNLMTADTAANFVQVDQQRGYKNQALYIYLSGVQQVSFNGAAFTTSGADIFPEPVSGRARVTAGGAGGGGGGTQLTDGSHDAVGGGGGSGAVAQVTFTGISGATTITINPPGEGVSGAAGTNGGLVSFGALLSCPGGIGGIVGTPQTGVALTPGGAGGATPTISGGIVNYSTAGVEGGIGQMLSLSVGVGGAGGNCQPFGGGGPPTAPSNPGADATGYGSGGSGAVAGISHAAQAGGDASTGFILVEF